MHGIFDQYDIFHYVQFISAKSPVDISKSADWKYWGELERKVFHNDRKADGRWLLAASDPMIIEGIN